MKKDYGFFVLFISILTLFTASSLSAKSRGISVELRASESKSASVVEKVDLYSSSYALVIGIDKYTAGWPRLSSAIKDAKLVADALREKGFEVTLKTNLDSSELKQAFEEFFIIKGDNPQARLFVWFAGHGHTLDGEGFLIPADAPDPEKGARFKLKALSMRRFGEYVRLARAKHAFAVFDSCFSGTIFATSRSKPPAAVTRATTLPVRQFMSSGDADQQVSDDGRFRKLFIRAIKGEERADANGDGYVTGSELGLFLTDRITNLTKAKQTPRYGKLLDEDYDRGDFVFLIASSGAVVDKPSVQQTKTTLSVESNISGAKVYVDNQYIGKTDLSNIEAAPGDHRIRVEKEGYEPYNKRIQFKVGRSMSLSVYLDREVPIKGSIYVDTTPENAKVRILNIDPRFYQGIELDAGRYNLEVSANGFQKKSMWISLEAGEDKRVDIRLKRVTAPESVESSGGKISNSIGMEFIHISSGSFMMGSPSSESGRDNDERQHRVTLTKGFYMQTTEVTQGQWKVVMGNNPSKFSACGNNCPVEKVSWNDAQEFIRKLNQREGGNRYRLPTEAEWEYAARAGTTTRYCFGDGENRLGEYAWYDSNSGSKTHPVGKKKANAWGVYDMHGNVWEWCQDWKGNYPSSSVTDPAGPSSGSRRVLRGGSWYTSPRNVRSANRGDFSPGRGSYNIGFRLLRTY